MSLLPRILVFALACGPIALALEQLPGGYIKTGEGTRVKKVALMKVDVYDISHSMKQPPSPLTAQAVIDANVDKKFDWDMLRSVDGKRLEDNMREAYRKNGYNDTRKIEQFITPLHNGLKDHSHVQIYYDAPTKTTTLLTPNGRATVAGSDFMKATWRIWFGNIDQPELTKDLLAAR